MLRFATIFMCLFMVFTVSADQVILQPTLSLAKDSYICEGNPSGNYGQEEGLLISLSSSGDTMTLICFNELDDYVGVTVNSAELEFYVEYINELIYVSAQLIDESWNEDDVTWANRPALMPGTDIDFTIPDFGCWQTLDITDYGIEWLENGVANNGFYMMYDSTTYRTATLCSGQGSDPTYAPRLILDYTPLAVETASWGAIKVLE